MSDIKIRNQISSLHPSNLPTFQPSNLPTFQPSKPPLLIDVPFIQVLERANKSRILLLGLHPFGTREGKSETHQHVVHAQPFVQVVFDQRLIPAWCIHGTEMEREIASRCARPQWFDGEGIVEM
jgi:hypothetical protein